MRIFPLILCLTAICTGQHTGSRDELKAYPPAEKGQVRYVWYPPELPDEDGARIELLVGRNIETDGVNNYSMKGTIGTVPIKGWGYERYVVNSDRGIIMTMKRVPAGTPKVNKFIKINPQKLIRYNSRLPVVVYAPEGVTVRFRIWRADDNLIDGQPG